MTSFMEEFEHLKIQLEEIKRATNSFGNKVIGVGGFGAVYEGEVSHSKGRSIVAIKRLNRKFGQGDPEFFKEIMMLSRYTHQNLISLLGFCDEKDEKVLVYEFASKGSLDRHLNDPNLTWVQRIKICLGAAKGLSYLHDPKGTHQRVIHCDIKSANILLDESLTPKVADFGLSKMGPANQQYSVLVTNAMGTAGYCDPQFMMTSTLTKESDAYSFGVVLFEVLCGRLCFHYSNDEIKVFVNTWKQKFSENKLNEIVFQHLVPQMGSTSLELFSNVAFQCLHNSRKSRPTMSIVVKKLEEALESQELYDLKVPDVYKEILHAAVPPLKFTCFDDLNKLLSNGVFLHNEKTWFTKNDHGGHYVMISLAECLVPAGSNAHQFSADKDSRFKVGCYSTYYKAFKIRAQTQILSPLLTYRVNLVFKFKRRHQPSNYNHVYLPLIYTLNGEKNVLIVYLANWRADKWLKAGLYQFTSHERTVDLEINFDPHPHCKDLKIDGIEFQPLEKVEVESHKALELKYGEILKAATHPLFLRSEAELNALLSIGVLFNDGKTWISRNDKGVNYVLKSIEECLNLKAGKSHNYENFYPSNYNSRFLAGSNGALNCCFKTSVRTEFLSPFTTYTVNLSLLFKFDYGFNYGDVEFIYGFNHGDEARLIGLIYKLDGETYHQVSHLAFKKEDQEWWTVELYHFTSDGTIFDLEIIIEGCSDQVIVDGIEFRPLEQEELQALEDDQKHVNLDTTLSDSEDDAYWKNKLPTDYKDIIKYSEQHLQWTTNKELYHVLAEGLLINYKQHFSFSQRPTNHGQQWFCLDKNGKTCLMLPARLACILKNLNHIKGKSLHEWKSLTESRFREVLASSSSNTSKHIVIKENKLQVLSNQTEYACYLVYKTESGGCTAPMLVGAEEHWGSILWKYRSFYIYLVSPQTPVIRPKAGQNTHNPLYRPKLKGLPQQRNDGWMEVQVWKFKTDTTAMTVIPSIRLEYLGTYLEGLIILGIEFRPI